jgi:tetratricopeptide (TPR) repeat protein
MSLTARLIALAVSATLIPPLCAQSPDLSELIDAIQQLRQQMERIQVIVERLSASTAGVKNSDGDPSVGWQEARKQYEIGIQAEKERRFEEAVEGFTRSLSIDPSNDAAYLHRGGAYLSSGKALEAIADFTQALRVQPNTAEAYRLRSMAYASLSRNAEAAADMNEAARRTGQAPQPAPPESGKPAKAAPPMEIAESQRTPDFDFKPILFTRMRSIAVEQLPVEPVWNGAKTPEIAPAFKPVVGQFNRPPRDNSSGEQARVAFQ